MAATTVRAAILRDAGFAASSQDEESRYFGAAFDS
jgi:hypothetical protein